ncbi:MAG: ABC transporter permease, partial [Acidobacteriia bacterium]|nr:ABC transporter permease [Terriglobia bacterium]
MQLLRLIWKNAIRNPRRSVLTILSITVSIFLVSTLQAILTRLDSLGKGSGSGHLRLVVHHATGLGQPLPVAYKQRIEALPGVKAVSGWTWFGGLYIDERNFFANFAVDADDLEKTHDEYRIPPDQLEAFKRERIAALVGRALMEQYHWKLGDRVTLKGTIWPIDPELTIRAVFTCDDESQERVFFFHWDYFNEALSRRNQVGTFAVKAATPEDVPRLMDAIDRTFHNSDAETKTETEQAFNLSFVSMLGNVKLLLNSISAAVVFT